MSFEKNTVGGREPRARPGTVARTRTKFYSSVLRHEMGFKMLEVVVVESSEGLSTIGQGRMIVFSGS